MVTGLVSCKHMHGCFITLAAWTKSCKLKFFRTAWQPHSNALPQYFRLSNKLLPHQARDFWHVVDTSSWNYCPQGGVGRKPGENRWFSGQVTSSRVTVVLDRVLGPLWTKEKFCEGWKTVICGASGFYSVAHVERSYLEFFGGADVLFKSAPSRVNVTSPQWLRN